MTKGRTPGQWTVEQVFNEDGTATDIEIVSDDATLVLDQCRGTDMHAVAERVAAALNAADTDLPPGVGRITHTDGEPTADDVFTWLRGHGWHDDRAEWLVVIQDVLDARAALLTPPDEPRTEPAEMSAPTRRNIFGQAIGPCPASPADDTEGER